MSVISKFGLSMSMPEGKLPGYYAQIVKALAGRTQLFDRDKDMLILSTPEDRSAVLEVMQRFKIATEELELLLLPEDASTTQLFEDYGFTTRLENRYLYAHLVALFSLKGDGMDAEPQLAMQQLDEYLITSFPSAEGSPIYAIDRQHDELATRIATAYHCTVKFHTAS